MEEYSDSGCGTDGWRGVETGRHGEAVGDVVSEISTVAIMLVTANFGFEGHADKTYMRLR